MSRFMGESGDAEWAVCVVLVCGTGAAILIKIRLYV